uniref:Uncharacterized protein n=1 Tax=Kalanchoe fedtschenkoi TaxID=63787 RepID=A0A7N0TUJ0_KALFE
MHCNCPLSCYKKQKETPCSKPMVPMESLEKNDLPTNKEVASAKQASFEEKPSEVGSLVYLAIYVENSSPAPHAQRPLYVDDPGEVLHQTQLQAIDASADIRDALKNEVIQQLILGSSLFYVKFVFAITFSILISALYAMVVKPV